MESILLQSLLLKKSADQDASLAVGRMMLEGEIRNDVELLLLSYTSGRTKLNIWTIEEVRLRVRFRCSIINPMERKQPWYSVWPIKFSTTHRSTEGFSKVLAQQLRVLGRISRRSTRVIRANVAFVSRQWIYCTCTEYFSGVNCNDVVPASQPAKPESQSSGLRSHPLIITRGKHEGMPRVA